ncbi:MAG: Uma2 family endonuclease [Clostridiaceae bacterium]|nr:Uma2 family endonuclease [Clostridiaceae bacterium]
MHQWYGISGSDKPWDIDTVVQPDIAVVCDESKTAGQGCKGAPDLIIEILSPSSMQYDQFIKLDLYQKAGVKEYWIVDPIKNTISVYLLEGRRYRSPVTYGADAKIPVSILEDCKIDLGLVFS